MATPYIVSLQVEQPAGTTLADVNVTLRQNATNEAATKTTNAQGQVVFQLAKTSDFASGYTIGDSITAFVIYQGFEGNVSKTITATDGGGYSTSLVLTAVASAPSLRYFTPQEFLELVNMKLEEDDDQNGVPLQQMVRIGEGVEKEIDEDTGTVFDDNDGDYYSQIDYFDDDPTHRVFTPTRRPVQAISEFTYNTARDGSADDWSTDNLTENTEYTLSPDTEKIRVSLNNTRAPSGDRNRGWRLTYTYGRSSVPSDIKQLAIYQTAMRMGYSSTVNAKIGGKDRISDDFDTWFKDYRMRIITRYRYQRFTNT